MLYESSLPVQVSWKDIRYSDQTHIYFCCKASILTWAFMGTDSLLEPSSSSHSRNCMFNVYVYMASNLIIRGLHFTRIHKVTQINNCENLCLLSHNENGHCPTLYTDLGLGRGGTFLTYFWARLDIYLIWLCVRWQMLDFSLSYL